MKKRMLSLVLTLALLATLSVGSVYSAQEVTPGTSYTYTQADHWGKESDIWSWQWALSDTTQFQDMTFTNVSGQGDCYVADWDLYPYCAARWGGNNVHPNVGADAARVFTAPASGSVTLSVSVARGSQFGAPTNNSPTSFRILLGDATVYPAEGEYLILTSTTPQIITLPLKVFAGEKIRFVVGAMNNQASDAVNLLTTVTYDTVGDPGTQRVGQKFAFSATAATWGQADPHWSWEYNPLGTTQFSPMTYQYVSSYNKNMYVAGWDSYPYSYVDFLGEKIHPALAADTVKTFTAPYSGKVKVDTSVRRTADFSDNGVRTPTSLRILVNDVQVYPLYSDTLVLTSATAKDFSFQVSVKAGDKIRFVVGGMGQIDSDALMMQNAVTYTSLEESSALPGETYTYAATAETWGTDIPHWSWEYRDQNNAFGPMTYQYISSYGKNMYASDWTNHTYNYVDLLGVKVHPAKNRDTVKTFTAPLSGRVETQITVSRYVEYLGNNSDTPTSLRVFVNDKQIYPADGSYITLTSQTPQTITLSADLKAGDKLRCVVGSIGHTGSDAIQMYNTVRYRSVGVQELAMAMNQSAAKVQVFDIRAENWEQNEEIWSWAPTAALGFTQSARFTYCTDAKLRYSPSAMKQVVAVSASGGFLGVVDYATGRKIWEVDATSAANPHSIEYLPNGNVAAAASNGGWVRIYKASQNSTGYVQANLPGAHGVLWDPQRNLLWAVGDEVITAYRIGGTAASPTITEATEYRVSLPSLWGHDLSAVYGNPDRLWVSTGAQTYQFDIPSKTFVTDYQAATAVNHGNIKGISNYQGSDTVIAVYPNNTWQTWNSDRIFVTLPGENGELFGITQAHSTGAFYKTRSWISDYVG